MGSWNIYILLYATSTRAHGMSIQLYANQAWEYTNSHLFTLLEVDEVHVKVCAVFLMLGWVLNESSVYKSYKTV
jgi:hypothetical protein